MEEMENVIKPDVAERRCENGTQIKSAEVHDCWQALVLVI
jgi:hypothetical protein